jgi:RNA recognition motif-containing protein
MIEYLGKSRIEKYVEKSRMEKFEKNTENSEDEKKSNEIKMMFVQEKIQDCMMRKQSDDTRKKLSKIMLNSCADGSLNTQEYDRAKEFLQDVNINS